MPKKHLVKKKLLTISLIVLTMSLALSFFIVFQTYNDTQYITIKPSKQFKETIIVVADKDYEPYSFIDKDGLPAGYDIDLLRAIGNKLHLNVEIRLLSWGDCLKTISKGDADLVLGMDYLPYKYPELIFSMAGWNDYFVCFGKKQFSSISELHKKRLAVMENSGSFAAFIDPYKLKERTSTYKSYPEALQSVASGENDYAIIRYSVGRRLLASMNLKDISAVGPTLANNSNCMAAPKKHTVLIEKINSALIELIDDGTVGMLVNKWLGRYVQIITLKDLLYAYANYILLAVGICALLIFVIIVSFYKKEVAAIQRENEGIKRLRDYQRLMLRATRGLYEEIHEVNLTPERCDIKKASSISEDDHKSIRLAPLDNMPRLVPGKIKDEFIAGYREIFLPQNALQAFKNGVSSLKYEFMMSTDGENYHWFRLSARIFQWEADSSVRMITFLENIDTETKHKEELRTEAITDALTGLYNKSGMETRVHEELGAWHQHTLNAMLVLDADNFKQINDEMGHAFGDEVLKQIAATLKKHFRSSDIIGRFGGDEFVIFLKDIPSALWLKSKLNSLNRLMDRDIVCGEKIFRISTSIGGALQSATNSSYELLFKDADKALYLCKKNGKNNNCILCEGKPIDYGNAN